MLALIYFLMCLVSLYNCKNNLQKDNEVSNNITSSSNDPTNVKYQHLYDINRHFLCKDIDTNCERNQHRLNSLKFKTRYVDKQSHEFKLNGDVDKQPHKFELNGDVDKQPHKFELNGDVDKQPYKFELNGDVNKQLHKFGLNKNHITEVKQRYKTFHEQNCAENRSVIVHLFNWKWTDVAKECQKFLGPKGFCGVQVSPPNEHKLVKSMKIKRPWWERYQPVSYKLGSRSGSPDEFAHMVKTCNNVYVRVYVDLVINHMMAPDGTSGKGSWGSHYNSSKLDFPAVPYNASDFHCCFCESCPSSSCGIDTYQNVKQVRNCRLLGLADLDLSRQQVREKVSTYLNHLLHLGVAGFRVDAAKHMWPDDLKAIFSNLIPLKKKYFGRKLNPFIYNEVIDQSNEAIHGSKYYLKGLGRVTEFKFSQSISKAFRGEIYLSHLKTLGQSWHMYPSKYALVFVDNHDNQRGHGSGYNNILTFYEPKHYKMATVFTLAWPYGAVRIMSSYRWGWNKLQNTDLGPPTNNGEDIKTVQIKTDGSCDDGGPHTWICEHRWRQITNMVKWRNIAGGLQWNVHKWWDNGGNHITFSRGGKAFIAFNNDKHLTMSVTLITGLPSGCYCDVISGDISDDKRTCSGKQFIVDSKSRVNFTITPSDEDPMIALHIDSRIQKYSDKIKLQQSSIDRHNLLRTVIFIQYNAKPDAHVFMRGGIGHARRKERGQVEDSAQLIFIITIQVKLRKFTKWQKSEKYLDWYGRENGQINEFGHFANGTPLKWTTNDSKHPYFHPLNTHGKAFWMLDVMMNCSQTENGWFEFKLYTKHLSRHSGWEGDIEQKECVISNGKLLKSIESVPYQSINHMAKCGHVNTFKANSPDCGITKF